MVLVSFQEKLPRVDTTVARCISFLVQHTACFNNSMINYTVRSSSIYSVRTGPQRTEKANLQDGYCSSVKTFKEATAAGSQS